MAGCSRSQMLVPWNGPAIDLLSPVPVSPRLSLTVMKTMTPMRTMPMIVRMAITAVRRGSLLAGPEAVALVPYAGKEARTVAEDIGSQRTTALKAQLATGQRCEVKEGEEANVCPREQVRDPNVTKASANSLWFD